MRSFIWQMAGWPRLEVDEAALLSAISHARSKQHHLLGALSLASTDERTKIAIDALSSSAIDTSKIEGEILDSNSVRSSVARRLGVDKGGAIQDDVTEGVVEMTVDAVREFGKPLTRERLWAWHAGLFPASLAEAAPCASPLVPTARKVFILRPPPGADVPKMMTAFLRWFEVSRGKENGLIRAAKARVWFLTLHPFHNGNGRIGRAIVDMALAQDESSGDRFYSLSAQIQREHNAYYDALESALRGTLDITKWVLWFAGCLTRAIQASEKVATQGTLNERQKRVLWRLLGDFEGNLNLRKYIAITKVSEATAQRDLSDLVDSGILKVEGKARATRYLLKADARMARDIRHR